MTFSLFGTKLFRASQAAAKLQLKLRPSIVLGPPAEELPGSEAHTDGFTRAVDKDHPAPPPRSSAASPQPIILGRSTAPTVAAEKLSGARRPPATSSNIITCHYSHNQWGEMPLVHYFMCPPPPIPPFHHTRGAAARQWQNVQTHGNKTFPSPSL